MKTILNKTETEPSWAKPNQTNQEWIKMEKTRKKKQFRMKENNKGNEWAA